MRILQVVPYFSRKRGGDVSICCNLSRRLSGNGHQVTVATTDFEFDENLAASMEGDGVRVVSFHCVLNLSQYLVSPSIRKWLDTNMRHYDMVHTHTYRSYQNSVIYRLAMKHSVPYVLQAHGSVSPYLGKTSLKKAYDLVWGKRMLAGAAKLIALTETEERSYESLGVDKGSIEVIPNGIEISDYVIPPTRGEFRRKYSIGEDEKVVLFLGRLHWSKGIECLMRAFFLVCKTLNNVRLVLVGPDFGYLTELLEMSRLVGMEEKVIFTGYVSDYEKQSAFVDADVFVSPSFSGFPVTFLEACFHGVPIVTTTKGDYLGWVHEKTGLVVNYDQDEVSEAILRILQNDALRKEFQIEGRRLVMNKFNWSMLASRFERLYENVLNEQSCSG